MQAGRLAGPGVDWRRVARDGLVLLAVAALLMAPEFVFGMRDTDSASYSIVWTRQYGDALARGEVYPRWFADSFGGLGSPAFYFYPPLAYFVCAVFRAVGLGVTTAITSASTAFFFASGASMYAWLKWKNARPLLGAVLYMIAPYRLFEVYSRGAIAEHAAFVWFPLIALGIEALPRRWAIPVLATAWGGLLITHLPMALLALCLLILPLAALRLRRDPGVILPGLAAGAAGVALGAFYLVPALTLQDYVKFQLLWTPFFQPSYWFIWRWTAGTGHALPLQALACGALLIAAARASSLWLWLTAAAAAVAFGLLPITALPVLSTVQFPWRALGLVMFFGATAIAMAPPKPLVAALALGLAAPAFVDCAALVARGIVAGDRPPMARIARETPDAPEYLPRDLPIAGGAAAEHNPDLGAYAGFPRVDALQVTRPGRYTFGRAAFPIWRVTHDGADVPTAGPLLSFEATSAGEYRIERRLLWQEIAGASATAVALIFLLVSSLLAWRRTRVVTPSPSAPAKKPGPERIAAAVPS